MKTYENPTDIQVTNIQELLAQQPRWSVNAYNLARRPTFGGEARPIVRQGKLEVCARTFYRNMSTLRLSFDCTVEELISGQEVVVSYRYSSGKGYRAKVGFHATKWSDGSVSVSIHLYNLTA
jgi:hypothetical protein